MVLYWNAPERGRDVSHGWVRADEPAPTIQAAGVFGVRSGQYGLVAPIGPGDDSPHAAGTVPPVPPGRPAVRASGRGNKPAYAVPDVAEIRKLSGRNGLVAASTFSGCGGSSTGYRMAGWDVRWASEFHDGAADCYEANWPSTTVDRRDIRDVTGEEIMKQCGADELDMLDGSPPCQPFSGAGKRHKGWRRDTAHADGTTNRGGSENLIGEWVRLVGEIRPRAAVMENVKGLTVGRAKGFLLETLERLRGLGYAAEARLLDVQWLGVPQRRVRCYVVAFRDDLGLAPVFPSPLPYRYSMADALPWLDAARVDGRMRGTGKTEWPTGRPSPTSVASGAQQNRPEVHGGSAPPDGDGASIDGYAIGEEWARPGPGGHSERYFNLVRPDPGEPSPTIMASSASYPSNASVTHPHEPRKFTILEVKRLSGFPDDYVLHGSYAEQWARLGNSVPPPMAAAVGRAVAGALAGAS